MDNAQVRVARVRVIVGLEVHVQLGTRTKLFCGCSTRFGNPPNSQVCPVCCGMPGAMPRLNSHALELAVRTTAALGGTIGSPVVWDRKQYFYPDLPKGYQISQLSNPVCQGGEVPFDIGEANQPVEMMTARIDHAHLEEDAGKSLHTGGNLPAGRSGVDLNRAGTPLMEIVTRPDFSSGRQARMFLAELRAMLVWAGISDGNMQEGNLRCDANVNLEIVGPENTFRTPIVEIKNLNSFRAVENAIDYEVRRQQVQSETTGSGATGKQTRGWNEQQGETFVQRDKESMADYRYMPEPDLPPAEIPASMIETCRPEPNLIPERFRERLRRDYGMGPYDSRVLVGHSREAAIYFCAVADACGDARMASNWIQQDVMAWLAEQNVGFEQYPVPADELARLLTMVADGHLNQARARDVLAEMVRTGDPAAQAVSRLGIVAVGESEIVRVCQQILKDNPAVAAEIQAGNLKATGPLIARVRKALPDANPVLIRQCLLKQIGE